ncbi:MAG: 30S ribosomal protein S20 [Candidatus Omnitrophota bacterium]
MPIKRSGFKRLRQDKKKHVKNKSIISEIRTMKKKARTLIAAKNREEADAVLKKLESKMDRAAKNNIIKKNNASRNISRLRQQWSEI